MGESAAALIKDGVLVAAAEEERFTRFKHEGCFPLRAIDYCLKEEGLAISDIEHVGVYWQPWKIRKRAQEVISTLWRRPRSFAQKFSRALKEFSPVGGGEKTSSDGSWIELFQIKQILIRNFGPFKGRIHYFDHHTCHIASSFLASPFEEATILSLDGGGEELSTTMAVGSGQKIKLLKKVYWPHSLGHFYSAITGFLGFKMEDGEYKMMGLAPYNTPDYLDIIRKEILITNDPGSFQINTRIIDYHDALANHFSKDAIKIFGRPRLSDKDPFNERHQKIASSAQAAFEEVVMDLALWAYKAGGGKKNICISGGCGLNCTANGNLLRNGPFEKMYIPPAPHDAGGSIGAALLVYHEILEKPRKFIMEHAHYGPSFSDEEVQKVLVDRKIYTQPILEEKQLLEKTVEYLASGKIIAWFQDEMEFGPRALGNRSFLADPRNDSIRDVINEKIKKRELFRPFAPSVKEECASDYFEINQSSPFMNITAPVHKAKMDEIPAVTHIDGSARTQTVSKEHNMRYWKLLDTFHKKTNVPVLLNTSFNIQEPIVCTPEDAIETFRNSNVDALVIQNYFISRAML